ncbi:MAG: ABC transporter permease [Clostridia bacterium]|jgi:putative ABC transport system permease protein|nr:ABC transporter permease [Clostridia bacterium]
MYILKNSVISIIRNKGRNILIGIIILVIACASTVTLAIRNTANRLVKNYQESHDIIATISFERKQLSEKFKGGEEAKKENIEAFNNIEALKIEDIKNYGDSKYLKGYYYIYTTSLNSDTLTKATDSYEYEVEDKQTTTSSSSKTTGGNSGRGRGPGPEGERHTITNNNTTTIITRTKETFQSSRNLTGDFEINGYSSYDAMTNFVNGTCKVIQGEMITDFNAYECVINSELATLNEISIGDKITLKSSSDVNKTYEFTVTGIYTDNSNTDDSQNMYSQSANKIITGSGVIDALVEQDSTLVTNITPSFIINSEEAIEKFTEEIKQKGLNEYYTINTNLEELQNATKSIENVKTFATMFLSITLIISSIVLFIVNVINIRERKYEIGVFRTIGVSKFKLTMQFILELLFITIIMLIMGTAVGSFLAKPIGNTLLQNEIEATQVEENKISDNFGKGPMNMQFETNVKIQSINTIDAVVDFIVIIQLFAIGVLLTLMSSLASMISIQRFTPLTILKERT